MSTRMEGRAFGELKIAWEDNIKNYPEINNM
jgi:hypothetical protein